MCPRHYIDAHSGYMEPSLWRSLVDEIAAESPGSVIIPFWRGESLLHPSFRELIEYALGRGLRIHIATNGQILTPTHADVLMRIEFLTFSVHTEQGFERAREFLSLKHSGGPVTQVSFVAGEDSMSILKKVIADSELMGFDSVRLFEEHTKDGVFGRLGYPQEMERLFCKKLTDTLVVAFDGTVSRCNHIWETEKGLSAADASIRDIWNSTRFGEIRSKYPDGFCGPCDQWTGNTCGESWRLADGKIVHTKFAPAGIVG